MHKSSALALFLVLSLNMAQAAEPLRVVTSFSILADMTRQVGGEQVEITSLVAPDSDIHAFSPSPTQARTLSQADVLIFNGLQLEGWLTRLIEASDYDGVRVTASDGISALTGDARQDDHGHDHGHGNGHDQGEADPHAWLDVGRAQQYVVNIRDGLIEADPDNAKRYRDNAERYLDELETLDQDIRTSMAAIPEEQRVVVTGHLAFGYFADAYALRLLSPAGLSTASAPSAAEMARLIDVIRDNQVPALFLENNANPGIIHQLAEETGLPIAGTLYSGALANEGDASTYAGMMRHNAALLHEGLTTTVE
ncbi:metal ABC transporter solute-binding protein, Zn/Mn family [Halomonas sp. M20]|uniref:metal ABC transporter solute-binding protein, Zn/Mn family n=1 Tax=Halomonas sp. M20 TaxID=2763264 RepID=UPI001D0B23AE|nr:zinc ABC transporter substrate-binding protein [Halomonas sp. M20]